MHLELAPVARVGVVHRAGPSRRCWISGWARGRRDDLEVVLVAVAELRRAEPRSFPFGYVQALPSVCCHVCVGGDDPAARRRAPRRLARVDEVDVVEAVVDQLRDVVVDAGLRGLIRGVALDRRAAARRLALHHVDERRRRARAGGRSSRAPSPWRSPLRCGQRASLQRPDRDERAVRVRAALCLLRRDGQRDAHRADRARGRRRVRRSRRRT